MFQKYLDLGCSPVEAEKLALEEFESMSQAPQEEVVEEKVVAVDQEADKGEDSDAGA